jgi:hypothetical protein
VVSENSKIGADLGKEEEWAGNRYSTCVYGHIPSRCHCLLLRSLFNLRAFSLIGTILVWDKRSSVAPRGGVRGATRQARGLSAQGARLCTEPGEWLRTHTPATWDE